MRGTPIVRQETNIIIHCAALHLATVGRPLDQWQCRLTLSVVDRVTTLIVFFQQPVLFHRDRGQQTLAVRN